MSAVSALRQLFGGAMTIVLPLSYIDVSDIRQVPDTQEVFLSETSDISFIIETLERVDVDDQSDAAKFHFDSIAHDNDAQSYTIGSIHILDQSHNDLAPVILEGEQLVSKFNRTAPHKVEILIALYRIKDKNVDLVLSMNIPIVKADGVLTSADDIQRAKGEFNVATRSLRIVDYTLFA